MDSLNDNAALPALSSLIRISADHKIFAPPRSFSQLVTSFFGAMYLGILRMLFVAWSFSQKRATLLCLFNSINRYSKFWVYRLQKFYNFNSTNYFSTVQRLPTKLYLPSIRINQLILNCLLYFDISSLCSCQSTEIKQKLDVALIIFA